MEMTRSSTEEGCVRKYVFSSGASEVVLTEYESSMSIQSETLGYTLSCGMEQVFLTRFLLECLTELQSPFTPMRWISTASPSRSPGPIEITPEGL